jgi:hypothetical protein
MQDMEVPQHDHFGLSVSWPAKLVPLHGTDSPVDIVVVGMASRLLTARGPRAMKPGLPVRIDQHGSILLGEVVGCREDHPSQYSIVIEMNDSLCGLYSLRNLVTALLAQAKDGDPRHPAPMPQVWRRTSEAPRRREW